VPELPVEPGLILMKVLESKIQATSDYFNDVSTNNMVAQEYEPLSFNEYILNLDLIQLQDAWPI
jgi:hypothetical protein